MSVKLLAEHHLEFLRLKGGCTDSSGSTLVKMPHCWKLHVVAQLIFQARIQRNCIASGHLESATPPTALYQYLHFLYTM